MIKDIPFVLRGEYITVDIVFNGEQPGESKVWSLDPTEGKSVNLVSMDFGEISDSEYKSGVPMRMFWVIQAVAPGKAELVFNLTLADESAENKDETIETQIFVFEVDNDLNIRFVPEESDFVIEPIKGTVQ